MLHKYDDDGNVLVAYYPQYLSKSIVSSVLLALFELVRKYPPPPSEKDIRRTDWESLSEMCGGKANVGVYHLCTWFEQGHLKEPPCLSSDAVSLKLFDLESGMPGLAEPSSSICQPIRIVISEIGSKN
jgi:hypothetical protein